MINLHTAAKSTPNQSPQGVLGISTFFLIWVLCARLLLQISTVGRKAAN
jgi:hypothetical protein